MEKIKRIEGCYLKRLLIDGCYLINDERKLIEGCYLKRKKE